MTDVEDDKYFTVLQKLNMITNNNIAEHNQSLKETEELINTLKEDMITMERDIDVFTDTYGEESIAKSKMNVNCMLDQLRKIREGVEVNEAKIKLMYVPQEKNDENKENNTKEIEESEYAEYERSHDEDDDDEDYNGNQDEEKYDRSQHKEKYESSQDEEDYERNQDEEKYESSQHEEITDEEDKE